MPDEENKTVDIDTSGPDAEVTIEETKDEAVIETENTEQETENTEEKIETKQELEEGGEVKEEKEKLLKQNFQK